MITALGSDVTEVIQIGAGFDSLCFRLHQKWPTVKFLEIDHPATHALKTKLVGTLNFDSHNLSFQAIDLENPNFGMLDSGKSRIMIAEGLLMYFQPDHVRALLKNLRQSFGGQARLLTTFLDGPGFKNQTPLVNLWLRFVGEPFQWWATRGTLKDLLIETGWKSPTFHATWKDSNFSIAEGEWIAETVAGEC